MPKRAHDPIINKQHEAAWTRFCDDMSAQKNLDFYEEIIGKKALILALAYKVHDSIEIAERNAKIPPRAGRAVLETALQAITYHIGPKINLYG